MKKARLLWLSDIHYCNNDAEFLSKYVADNKHLTANKKSIEKYLLSIKTKINDLKPTHILISGDLTFSGMHDQYEDMYNTLLKEYLDKYKEVRLIPIIGNHDLDRTLLQALQEKLPLGEAFLDYTARKNKLDEVKKLTLSLEELQGIYEKNKDAFHFNVDKSHDKYKKIDNFNLYDLCFFNYKDFWKTYVESRFNAQSEINILLGEDETYNIIHDKEYNLIFINLNSAWFAWGDDTYKTFDPKINFKEYGQLTYNTGTFASMVATLTDNKSLLHENVVICQGHHGFPWIAYEELYNAGISHLQKLLSEIDIFLTGHIHVPHNAPSKIYDRTYCFESPQLLDYHLYKEYIENERLEMAKNHGFSTFEISENLKSVSHEKYVIHSYLDNDKKLIHPFSYNSEHPFSWHRLESTFDFNLIKSIKSNVFEYPEKIADYFRCLTNSCSGDYPLIDMFKLDLTSFVNDNLSLKEICSTTKKELSDLIIYVNDATSITHINFFDKNIPSDFTVFSSQLLSNFTSIQQSISKAKRIDFILLDIHLHQFFKIAEKATGLIEAKRSFEEMFKVLIYNFYEKNVSKVNIGFKLFTLSQYRAYICE